MKTKLFFLILLSVLCINSLNAQKNGKKIKISGYVTDKNLFPVVNAGIFIDNINTNIVTDDKGYFKVKANPLAEKIAISASGSKIEEAIHGRTRINFTFAESIPQHISIQNQDPNEDQINVGYGTVKKKNLISPVNRIDGNEKRYSSYTSIYDMIRGQVPGVQVSGNNIRIQNSSSFLLKTRPLFVVDGVTVESIDNVVPQMVSSIEVLKGASASIYGSRGANGVILITLKR